MPRGTRATQATHVSTFPYGTLTLSGGPFQDPSGHSNATAVALVYATSAAPQPAMNNGHDLLHSSRLGSSPFARRYSGNLA